MRLHFYNVSTFIFSTWNEVRGTISRITNIIWKIGNLWFYLQVLSNPIILAKIFVKSTFTSIFKQNCIKVQKGLLNYKLRSSSTLKTLTYRNNFPTSTQWWIDFKKEEFILYWKLTQICITFNWLFEIIIKFQIY